MDSNSLVFSTYWRNSLADAEFGQGTFSLSEAKKFTVWSQYAIETGKLDQVDIDKFFNNEPENIDYVDVVLCERVYLRLVQHNKERSAGLPSVLTPLITHARLSRSGYLFPTSSALIPRDLLEPLPKGVFSIGEMDSFDRYKTLYNSVVIEPDEIEAEENTENRHKNFIRKWQSYIDNNEKLLKTVAGEWIENPDPYLKAPYGYILKKEQTNSASRYVLALYDHFFASKKNVPLFSRLAALEVQPLRPLLDSGEKFIERLSHSSDQFPLVKAQRDALSHFLTGKHGDILAVNGPPGTGKTTLILSIIATLWSRAALVKGDPPVILAISTNNQAVTNIIEAFGKDFAIGEGVMAGRWLPDIKSFGAYFPSNSRKVDANKKYQTEEFFEKIETKEYLEKAEAFYLKKAKQAFPNLDRYTPENVIEVLYQQLNNRAEELKNIYTAWQSLSHIRNQRAAISDDIEIYITEKQSDLRELQDQLIKIKEAEKKWHAFLADESVMYSLFWWSSAIKRKRCSRIIREMEPIFEVAIPDFHWSDPKEIEPYIRQSLRDIKKVIKEHQDGLELAEQIVVQEKLASSYWHSLGEQIGADGQKELTFEYVDQLADTTIRYPIFQLATHYWEGRWLIDMLSIRDLQEEKKKKGRKMVIPRWYRRMKLTPCVVSTCFMLPEKMKVVEYKDQRCFEDDYLYDFADLLIVDEAGQVSPEVAAASFALAKQALVIGDTEQIAPIVGGITPVIDIGNMLSCKLLVSDNQKALQNEYEAISLQGKSSVSGSVMKIAQSASYYQYDPQLARGMYLYEHRRCYDNIINFCNDLCYQGKLLPRRGVGKNNLFPAMGYLHIDGRGVKVSGGSRHNILEAEIIAAWISENRLLIEERYDRPIHKVVGVVTPFGAQVVAIKRALKNHQLQPENDNETTITVGSVHTLQGAERSIIIFSSVYSKHEDGSFIDRDKSILNVAVSRAKDSFLVFGDMDLFEVQGRSVPRGLLANYLFSHEKNQLYFKPTERHDLKLKSKIQSLHGAEEHDAFLLETLSKVKKNLTIVSPWLIWYKLEQTGFLAAMTDACRRGVDIHVLTDKGFNDDFQTENHLHTSIQQLTERGIKTKLVNRVHSKIVMGDDTLLCVGSYNWFSASRDDKYVRYDTSLVYRGNNLVDEINTIRSNLEHRVI
ncbi:AAA domain-containing protein [Arsenophonus nasoniae]|uniref:AAA domain-containing protein n=1 Tax=Arsenophonus nasoniae TaxID=638 RepID=UPI003879F591